MDNILGFSPRVNKDTSFMRLMDRCMEGRGVGFDDDINPDWIGVPVPLFVPILDFIRDDNYPGQGVGLKILQIELTVVKLSKDPWLCLGRSNADSQLLTIRYELPSSKLNTSELTLFECFVDQTNNGLILKNHKDLFRMYDTPDVEQLLSCYFSLKELRNLNIVSLKPKT